jgi:hypothetical protein
MGEHFGVFPPDLKSRNSSKAIAFPRQVAMYLVQPHFGISSEVQRQLVTHLIARLVLPLGLMVSAGLLGLSRADT